MAVGDGSVTNAVLVLFEQLHDQLRDEITGLDLEGLNWAPMEGANSISTIVTHLVGSEAETIRTVAGLPSGRIREAEFSAAMRTSGELFDLIDEADDLIAVARGHINAERLEATLALPTLPPTELRTGLTWLVGNYGHAREHLGHVQLTKQLYLSGRSSDL